MGIIKYLQSIQDNMVGIVLPVVITAFVSLITVFTNTILQIILQYSKVNGEQYKIMQEFYPKMKLYLLESRLAIQEVENSPICEDLKRATLKYILYKSDEVQYRRNNENEVQHIDEFVLAMDNFSSCIREINSYLVACTLPRPPIIHPIFRIRVSKMLVVLQYYSLLWDKYYNNTLNITILKREIDGFKNKWKVEMNSKIITKYIKLLDKWFLQY